MSVPPNDPFQPVPYGPSADERSTAMLAHLSAFAGFLAPVLGHIGGPLLVFLLRGNSSPFVSYHAREALNFNITMAIVFAVSGVLVFIGIGLLLLFGAAIVWCVLTIIAALKARDGLEYRYPFTLRLIPER